MIFKEEAFKLNSWVTLIKRFIPNEIEPFIHLLTQDYVTIIALNKNRLVLVKQFRVALNAETVELPGGLVDFEESPTQTAINELKEEVGLIPASKPFNFPVQHVDSARLSSRVHAFFFKETIEDIDWIPENGISRIWVNQNEIPTILENGLLTMSSHSGMLALLKTLGKI